MDDLISRQAAIAYAISGRIRALPTTEDGEDWIRVSEVRESLIAVPSAQQWIPVTERLPEEDKNVLVSVHFLGLDQKHKTGWNDHIKENWYVDIASHIDGDWTSYSDEYKVASNRHIIVAWMPLPEPWKGENK